MASLGGGGDGGNCGREELKSQFTTREGTYRLVSAVDFSRSTRPVTYVTNNTSPAPGTSPPVRLSFVTIPGDLNSTTGSVPSLSSPNSHSHPNDGHGSSHGHGLLSPSQTQPDEPNSDLLTTNHRFCFNMGKELLVYPFMECRKIVDVNKPMDKRGYKGTNPTCHDFNAVAASHQNLPLLIGFSGGQIQYVDSVFKEVNKLYNEERVIDKTRVTCIRWLPNSTTLFLVAHASGHMYLYNVDTACGTTAPHYQMAKHGPGYTVWNCKSKTPRNPMTRWTIGDGAVNEFDFSPCGQFLAVVSQDGFLRIFRYDSLEMVGITRSYFGGLLCVGWSPDGNYICVGGEDDLVTLWSFNERRVVARGQGHKSWVAAVAFDPFTTTYGNSDSSDDCIGDRSGHEFQSSGVFLCDSVTTCETDSSGGAMNTAINSTSSSASGANNNNQNNNSSHNNTNSTNLTPNPNPSSNPNGNNTNTKIVVGSAVAVKQRNNLNSSNSNANTNNNSNSNPTSFSLRKSSSRTDPCRMSSDPSMRISTSESTTATRLPACYRLGSVGQDTQLCLWDLTEDVIKHFKQPVNGKSRPVSQLHGNNHGLSNFSDLSPSNFNSLNSKFLSNHVVVGSSSGSSSNNSHVPNTNNTNDYHHNIITDSSDIERENHHQSNHIGSNDIGEFSNTVPSNSNSNSSDGSTGTGIGSAATANGNSLAIPNQNQKSNGNSNQSSGHSILSIRFGGLNFGGDKDKDKIGKEKEHKRNFSLGSSKNDKNNLSGNGKGGAGTTAGLFGLGVNVNLEDPLKLIGTQACPRLDECPLLEPLVCKKISHERLTSLAFREESIVTACQDGIICTWARPGDVVSQL